MNIFCSKDCPDLCGVKSIKNNGKFTFQGIPEEWSETGFVCSKFKVFAEREINNGLKSWQIINGNKVTYSSDSDAIDALAQLLEEYRGKKVLYMKGSGSLAYNMGYWNVLFARFDNCWSVSGGPCDDTGADAHEADFGVVLNPPVTNLEKADTIILYGKNAAVCSQHLYAYLKKLKKQGKTIIYIDPVRTKTADLADKYVMINPCCDGLLACALLTELGQENGHNSADLIKKAGISKADFAYILDNIKNTKTAHIQGFGIQRQSNGMNAYQWLSRLAVKTGSQELLYHGHGSKKKWEKLPADFKGYVHVDKVAEALANGDFDLYINVAANPAMTYPDTNKWVAGLSKTKTIVIDTNNTETSAHADFFFKVGGMFAQKDYMGSYFFSQDYSREKLTDEMSDCEACKLLADKLNISIDIKEKATEVEVPQRKYVAKSLPLTMPETSDKFQFISSSHHAYLNSQILPGMEIGLQVIHINTKDAETLGIKTGEDVKVVGETGEFVAEALVTDGIAEKTLMCWKNIPMKSGYINCAVPNKLTDSGNGLDYYTTFVDLMSFNT